MTSASNPLIGYRFPVHEEGFVELLDFMGSDQDIAEAAWVSTEFGNLNKSPIPQFLDYLMRHKHWSPFEMCEVKFRVYLPLAVEAQWVTHRTASKNQASARYVELPDNNFQPLIWRGGSVGHNKQGSGGRIEAQEAADEIYQNLVKHSREAEQALRALGVAPELARFTQLQSQYTMKVWKMDLRNLMNFLAQRTDSHAQQEIRVYAGVIEYILKELFPHAMKAWENHIKYAVTFSQDEQDFLASLLRRGIHSIATEQNREFGTWSNAIAELMPEMTAMRKSRQNELMEKLNRVLEHA